MKNFYLMLCLTVYAQFNVYAQTPIEKNTNHNLLLVNTDEKKKVEDFKKNESLQITNHREDLRKKRVALKAKEDLLLKDVTDSKNNGALTNEQKESFKVRHSDIKKEAEDLSRLNTDFMNKIFEQRKAFYNQMKK